MVEKEVVVTELSHAVLTKLAYLASTGKKSVLEDMGVSADQASLLMDLSANELNRVVRRQQDSQPVQTLILSLLEGLNEQVPEEYRPYLEHGANNCMMEHFFGVPISKCRDWRHVTRVNKSFRGRKVPDNKHSEVCRALLEKGDYRELTAEALLEVAQAHQVSLCALWNEIKRWEKENEQDQKK